MYSPLPRSLLIEHLRQAREHVALGERHLARQREIVGEYERLGLDVASAAWLLSLFEELQVLHVAGRDRLEEQLASIES